MKTLIVGKTVDRCKELATQFGQPNAIFFTRRGLSGANGRGLVLDMVLIDGDDPIPAAVLRNLHICLMGSGGPMYQLTEVK